MEERSWTPESWRTLPISQQPDWEDLNALSLVEKELQSLPPLVYPSEIRDLQSQMAKVAKGKAFVLQAGDCAESMVDFSADVVKNKLQVILQMAVVLMYSSGVPIIKLGRIAGQFAKPRSSPFERVNGVELPVFRGHNVNGDLATFEDRRPDPNRLLAAYRQSSATINLLRSLTKGGFSDLSQVHTWNQRFVAESDEGQRYDVIAKEIERALKFMAACGIDLNKEKSLRTVDFWTSHEALLLGYEEALTRYDRSSGTYLDLSAHSVWIGERTRELDHAHIEFFRGIGNPIACKVGPKADPKEVISICEILNPNRVAGRLTLVSRMGAENVESKLPSIVKAVTDAGHPVIWSCDPMHGNTFVSENGFKTRNFEQVMAEVAGFFRVHRKLGTWPGGLHVELTGEDVTECLGGSLSINEEDLDTAYNTICDPRLNARQSLDLAYRVAELLISM
ncbi:MAG: 3-deoxy-7-phosphoheptulonate synthase class II [Actinomycetota bacterium]|nr:3-deoxy-7-phosphoheptulonate synthase class II [Actinomycetota bacterium]